jgi:hypothetical protein
MEAEDNDEDTADRRFSSSCSEVQSVWISVCGIVAPKCSINLNTNMNSVCIHKRDSIMNLLTTASFHIRLNSLVTIRLAPYC